MSERVAREDVPAGADAKTMRVDRWGTPATYAEVTEVGGARLARHQVEPGYYFMEGVQGYLFYKTTAPITQTCLQRRTGPGGEWATWMIDDPTHWYGMEELAERLPPGRVLCAGLGLGLMVHHLVSRPDVDEVHVVELCRDVIELVRPTLPEYGNVRITCADFYQFIAGGGAEGYDAILWDLAVGDLDEAAPAFELGAALAQLYAPNVPFFQFGRDLEDKPEVQFARRLLRREAAAGRA